MATIESLINTVQQHGYANELAEAEEHGRLALEAIAELRRQGSEHAMEADAHEARLRNILAVVAVINGDHAAAVEMADAAIAAAERAQELQEKAMALGTLGLVYSDLTDLPKALHYQEQALRLAEQLNDNAEISRCNGNIGAIYYKLGETDTAMQYSERSYQWLYEQSLNATSDRYDKQLAAAISNMGSIHFSREEHEEARSYFERALALNEAGGDHEFVCINLSNIGSAYAQQEEYGKATQYLQRAIEIAKRENIPAILASSLTTLGEMVSDVDAIKQAIRIAQEIGDQMHLHLAHFALGRVLESQGDPVEALHHFQEGYRIEREHLGAEATRQAMLLEHRQRIEASERDRQVKLARFQ